MGNVNTEIERYVNKSSKSVIFYVVSTIVTLYAIFWLQYFIFGGIAVGIIIFVGFNSGMEIDFSKQKYRSVKFLGPISFGTWLDLPEIKYISVFSVKIVSGVRGLSNTRISNTEKAIQVNLIHGKNERLKIYQTTETEDAFSKATTIAKKLNLKIYDATSGKGDWLE